MSGVEELFISTGTIPGTAGVVVTNILLFLAFFVSYTKNGSEGRQWEEGRVCGAHHQSDHSVVWEKLPSSVIQRCTAA